jgi:hypothetical protein
MVSTIICEVGTIICDIGTINVRFYLLEVRYPHEYCRITYDLDELAFSVCEEIRTILITCS